MPRLMSFAMTVRQMRAKTKRVTRRVGWAKLRPGEIVCAVVKSQGLKKGEKVEKIGMIRILSVSIERVNRLLTDPAYGRTEVDLEGFPDLSPDEFVAMLCKANAITPQYFVRRIEFNHEEEKQ